MAPQFVKPYVKTNKNDAADAEAICEAVARPNMRFVPVKDVEQQARLALHRVRQGFVKARTAQANRIRGLLAAFGLIVPQGIAHRATCVPELLEDGENERPGTFRLLVLRLMDHLKELDRQATAVEVPIAAWHRDSALSRKRAAEPGAEAALQRRQERAAGHGQARQHRPAHTADPRQRAARQKENRQPPIAQAIKT